MLRRRASSPRQRIYCVRRMTRGSARSAKITRTRWPHGRSSRTSSSQQSASTRLRTCTATCSPPRRTSARPVSRTHTRHVSHNARVLSRVQVWRRARRRSAHRPHARRAARVQGESARLARRTCSRMETSRYAWRDSTPRWPISRSVLRVDEVIGPLLPRPRCSTPTSPATRARRGRSSRSYSRRRQATARALDNACLARLCRSRPVPLAPQPHMFVQLSVPWHCSLASTGTCSSNKSLRLAIDLLMQYPLCGERRGAPLFLPAARARVRRGRWDRVAQPAERRARELRARGTAATRRCSARQARGTRSPPAATGRCGRGR